MKSPSSTLAPAVAVALAVLAAHWWIFSHSDAGAPSAGAPRNLTIAHPSKLQVLPFHGAFGGESIAFDSAGDGPYVGVSDGRILKWSHLDATWHDFAFISEYREACASSRDHEATEHTCGRPLGLRFHVPTGNLYIADAYKGLLVVGPNGGLATQVWPNEPATSSFQFANGLDIDQSTGIVYFTLSSTRYQRRNYIASFLTQDESGRFMKYDPRTKQVSTLVENLKFPNGVSLSQDGSSVLIIESITCKVLRYWLEGTLKAGTLETVTEFPGFPDNIKRNENGGYWVGVYAKKTWLSELAFSLPWIGNAIAHRSILVKVAQAVVRRKAIGMGFRLSRDGETVEALEDRSGVLKFVSEVEEKRGDLYFGSVIMPFVGVLKDVQINT